MESGRTPFWKDATWRPFLQPTGSHTLCWPNPLTTFQNFCGTIAQCFKISFQSTKNPKKEKNKKVCASLILPQLAISSQRPRAASQTTLNKQAVLGRCEMKNGTFRTSVKFQWVGAAECVCKRLMAIDDLSEQAMKLTFIWVDTLSPCRQPIIKKHFLTVPGPRHTPLTGLRSPFYITASIFLNVVYFRFS